jgi:protein-arginine kinase activator protein McsA
MSDYSKAWIAHDLPELKSCPLPFCDGEGTYSQSLPDSVTVPIVIFCTECGLTLDNEFSGGEYGCIELWNARTTEEIDALLDADQYHTKAENGTVKQSAAPGYDVFRA